MFDRIINEVVTPQNVALGHTWLKRKLREALIEAMNQKPQIIETTFGPEPSITQMVRAYYIAAGNGIEWAESRTKEYFESFK